MAKMMPVDSHNGFRDRQVDCFSLADLQMDL